MEAKAYLRDARLSPRKVMFVLDLIRGKDADVAMGIIKNLNKGSAVYLEKLLGSAIANAEHNFNMDRSKLYVSECFVCKGHMKYNRRRNPRAKGSADQILRRTCHITVAVAERA